MDQIENAAIEVERCLRLNERVSLPLFGPKREHHPDQRTPWRIAPEPYWLSADDAHFFEQLGDSLLAFYRAANKLYLDSAKGRLPAWIADYLDRGKPPEVVEFARMNRFKNDLPSIIRPDVLPLADGFAISELDSIPGGLGFTSWLGENYAAEGFPVLGGAHGMTEGFASMVRSLHPEPTLAIVISRESSDYWEEMNWLSDALNRRGLAARVLRPEELEFSEEGLRVEGSPVDVLYRFFELFDLKNVPKAELFLYAAKKAKVALTPPVKPYLEEKMLFALFHHSLLRSFWETELGEGFALLEALFPQTWILDDRAVPPHAVIPGLSLEGHPLHQWLDLLPAKKRERDFVLKISGFSELAWGSHGVSFGKDLSGEDWESLLHRALASFEKNPFILQRYRKPRRLSMRYLDFASRTLREMEGRARLCPYYFVRDGKAVLGGILATICPADKLAIHGMTESVMVPCALEES